MHQVHDVLPSDVQGIQVTGIDICKVLELHVWRAAERHLCSILLAHNYWLGYLVANVSRGGGSSSPVPVWPVGLLSVIITICNNF